MYCVRVRVCKWVSGSVVYSRGLPRSTAAATAQNIQSVQARPDTPASAPHTQTSSRSQGKVFGEEFKLEK